MRSLSRRSFLSLGASFSVLALTNHCGSDDSEDDGDGLPDAAKGLEGDASRDARGNLRDAGSSNDSAPTDPVGDSGGPGPATTSFGPNGTHYPATLTPLGKKAPTEIEVDCSWAAIDKAIRALTAAQVAAGAAIRVKPGSLVGQGAGSTSPAMLTDVGNSGWTRNVLIAPRDGYGSVTATAFRWDKCRRISLFGFKGIGGAFAFTECTDVQIGWGEWSGGNITRSGANIDLYELVLGFRRDPNDTCAMRPNDLGNIEEVRRYGCVFGPSVKPAASGAHCDTFQLERTGGSATFGPLLSYDCVDFGSSNAALLLHPLLKRAEFHHCMILAGTLPWEVYPLASGDYQGDPNAFAGGCEDVQLYDSFVCGAIGSIGYTNVMNTKLNYTPQKTQVPTKAGAWTVDTTISAWKKADIFAKMSTDLSAASFAKIWKW